MLYANIYMSLLQHIAAELQVTVWCCPAQGGQHSTNRPYPFCCKAAWRELPIGRPYELALATAESKLGWLLWSAGLLRQGQQ